MQILLAAATLLAAWFSYVVAIIISVVSIGVAIGLAAIASKGGMPITGSVTCAVMAAVALITNVIALSISDNPDFTSTIVFAFIVGGCCIITIVISAVGIAKK